MLLDIAPPFSDLTGMPQIAVDPQPFLFNRSLRPRLFPAILLASAPPTPLLGAAMDGVSRLLVRDAGFRHTSPTGRRARQSPTRRRARQPERASSTSGRRRSTVSPAFAHQARKSRIRCSPRMICSRPTGSPKSRAMATRPLCCFCYYLQRNISDCWFRPGNPAAHYLVIPGQRPIMRSWQLCRRRLCRQVALAPIRPLSERNQHRQRSSALDIA